MIAASSPPPPPKPHTYKSFHVSRQHGHVQWSRNIPPALTVSPGTTVTFDTIDSSNGQIEKTSTVSSIPSLDINLANPVFGPVFVESAQPGDVLRVEVVDLQVADWGWSAIIPGFGLLADEFPDPALKIWELDREAGVAALKPGVRIPLRPFLGCMGVAPASDEGLSVIPPTAAVGGNMDCRDMTVGSVVYFPVQAAGALFSCGDGHAAQGHGEVCGTAIETRITATLRLDVCKDQPWITAPQYQTPPSHSHHSHHSQHHPQHHNNKEIIPDKGNYATLGIADTLLGATKTAVQNLINWLVATRGLSRTEAYILASVSADLHIAEAVNMPNYAVSMTIPLGIFS